MAEDNNVALGQLELLGQLADKQEEMRSKNIALTTVEPSMFNFIMQLPAFHQKHRLQPSAGLYRAWKENFRICLIRLFLRLKKQQLQHHAMLRGRARQWLLPRLLLPVQQSLWTTSGGGCCIGRRTRSILRMSVRQAHIMDPAHSTRQIHPPSEPLDLHEIHSPSEEC
jgi:hypothetical protein